MVNNVISYHKRLGFTLELDEIIFNDIKENYTLSKLHVLEAFKQYRYLVGINYPDTFQNSLAWQNSNIDKIVAAGFYAMVLTLCTGDFVSFNKQAICCIAACKDVEEFRLFKLYFSEYMRGVSDRNELCTY